MKEIFIDIETTGINPKVHGIIQIAFIICIDGEIKERCEFKVKPFPQDSFDISAMNVHGYTLEQILSFPEPKETYEKMKNIFSKYVDKFNKYDKFIFYGYKPTFDSEFLSEFWKKNGDQYFFSWVISPVDVRSIAIQTLVEIGKNPVTLDSTKLKDLLTVFEIEFDESKTHDALYDIEMTMKLQRICTANVVGVDIPAKEAEKK